MQFQTQPMFPSNMLSGTLSTTTFRGVYSSLVSTTKTQTFSSSDFNSVVPKNVSSITAQSANTSFTGYSSTDVFSLSNTLCDGTVTMVAYLLASVLQVLNSQLTLQDNNLLPNQYQTTYVVGNINTLINTYQEYIYFDFSLDGNTFMTNSNPLQAVTRWVLAGCQNLSLTATRSVVVYSALQLSSLKGTTVLPTACVGGVLNAGGSAYAPDVVLSGNLATYLFGVPTVAFQFQSTITPTITETLSFPVSMSFFPPNYFNVKCSACTGSISTNSYSVAMVGDQLAMVPITSTWGTTETFEPANPVTCMSNELLLDSITLEISDPSGIPLTLLDYFIVIAVDYISKEEKTKPGLMRDGRQYV